MDSCTQARRSTAHRALHIYMIGVLLLLGSSVSNSEQNSITTLPGRPIVELELPRRLISDGASRWSASIDNDLFAPLSADRDYTGGFNISISGDRAGGLTSPQRRIQQWLDRRVGLDSESEFYSPFPRQKTTQFGLLVFTPDDIEAELPISDDRPYANLLFLSTSWQALSASRNAMRQSTLTVGVLGSSLAKDIQTAIHKRLAASEPRGYEHQISDGGEITARYAVAYHSLLFSGGRSDRLAHDLKLTVEGAAGYLTETAIGVGLRLGRIISPWWSSISEYADYGSQPSPVAPRVGRNVGPGDFYLFAGLKLRARVYNAFLQGQFSESDVTFGFSDLHHLLTEAWLGITTELGRFRVSYTLRYQSAELRRGVGARDISWAGITVARTFH
jgi:hypothetical protein